MIFSNYVKTIYPDVLTLRKGEELVEIRLTFNEPIDSINELGVNAEYIKYKPEEINIINLRFSKDTLKFFLYINKSGFITIDLILNSKGYKLVTYVAY